MNTVGILSYGHALPKYRMKVEDVLAVWRNAPLDLVKSDFNVQERAVLGPDEDVITLSVAAAKHALQRIAYNGSEVDAFYLGTCTNPYDSRASSSVILEALGARHDVICADVQFAGKSGTAAVQICQAMVSSGMCKVALAVGADTINRHTSPGDLQESYSGAGAAAVLIGDTDYIAEIEDTVSYVSDLPDSFRVQGERFIRSGMGLGQDKNEIGITEHTRNSVNALLKKLGTKPSDYAYAVLPQTLASTPLRLGRSIGFEEEQISPSIYAHAVGDTGSASPLLGLAKVLDVAKQGDRILLASYGFGAGSDAMSLKVTRQLAMIQQDNAATVQATLDDAIYVDYATSIKYEFKYLRPEHPLTAYL